MKKRHIVIGAFLLLWLGYCFIPIVAHRPLQIGEIKILDRHDYTIAHLPKKDGLMIPINDDELLPEQLINDLLKTEDQRFRQHFGIDIIAKFRALQSNISAKDVVSGGSTLTEQWIKNHYFRGYRRTLVQKLREATLAPLFSVIYSKDELLRLYMNEAFFGPQVYGFRAASLVYFGKSDLNSLNDFERVTLLTFLRSPLARSTNETYYQGAFERVANRLELAVELRPLDFEPFQPINRFPHVTTSVMSVVRQDSRPNLLIKTNIDAHLQSQADEIISHSVNQLKDHKVQNGAAYLMRPQTGEILVWQGSKDFYDESIDGQVNVIQKKRQMGSALKPFIYLYAFLNGAHPDQYIVDLEKDFYEKKSQEALFRPLNYSLTEGGVIPIKEALASSFNISAVRLTDYLGLSRVYDFMSQLGIHFDFPADHYGLSLALGTPDLTLKNIADTYGALANQGQRIEGQLIQSINGESILVNKKQVLDLNQKTETALFHLYDVLSSQTNRRRSFGLNSILNTSIPFAVKTGTTRQFKDNWTFGYRPDLVAAVWVGNNDGSSMVDVTGVTGAAPIWHRLVELAIDRGYVNAVDLSPPSYLNEYQKCLDESCRQKERYFNEENLNFESNQEQGKFCLADFYIQDIDPIEIIKVAKLFNFSHFSIDWCDQKNSHIQDSNPLILKPADQEIFYIKKSIPLSLQSIIIKSDQVVDWLINNQEHLNTSVIFLEPVENKYKVQIKNTDETVSFEVRYVD